MPNARDIEMKLPSLDDLFSSQEERDDAKLKRIYDTSLKGTRQETSVQNAENEALVRKSAGE